MDGDQCDEMRPGKTECRGKLIRFQKPDAKIKSHGKPVPTPCQISFDRRELNLILRVYGFRVASGEWRDYAIDMLRERAVFSVFRRASEVPQYTIEKNPKQARKQGAFCIVSSSGQILKRGHELAQVLKYFDKRPELVLA